MFRILKLSCSLAFAVAMTAIFSPVLAQNDVQDSDGSQTTTASENEVVIDIVEETVEMHVNDSEQLSIQFKEEITGSIRWTSSDEAIVKVDENGMVTALSEGNAVIKAELLDDSAVNDTCEIIVTSYSVDIKTEIGNVEINLPDTNAPESFLEALQMSPSLGMDTDQMMDGLDKEAITSAIASEDVTDNTEVVVTRRFQISEVSTTTDEELSKTSLTLDIKPIQSVNIMDKNGEVVKEVEAPHEVELTLPVEMTIPVGDVFDEYESEEVEIIHKHDDKEYIYKGVLSGEKGAKEVTFINEYGFSPFTLTAAAGSNNLLAAVTSYKDITNTPIVLLYPSDKADADILTAYRTGDKADAVYEGSAKEVQPGTSRTETGIKVEEVKDGKYKMLVYMDGKYIPVIKEVTVSGGDVDLGTIDLYLYGDVNFDGEVNTRDSQQILRYYAGKTSVFDQGSEEEKELRKTAANVTWLKLEDNMVDSRDSQQILRYYAKKTSVLGEGASEVEIEDPIIVDPPKTGFQNEVINGKECKVYYDENSNIVKKSFKLNQVYYQVDESTGAIIHEQWLFTDKIYMEGIDISEHNGNIDLSQYQNGFVIIRIGWWTNPDKTAVRNMDLCDKYNIPYGVYLYDYTTDPDGAIQEAEFTLRMIAGRNIRCGVWFDMEDDGWRTRNGVAPDHPNISKLCQAYCSRIAQAGYHVGIYASYSWFENYIHGCDQYDKWVAHWGSNNGNWNIDLSNYCPMHQFTSTPLDRDVIYVDPYYFR